MAKLWFKARRFGWGWTPITKEGWFVVGAFIAWLIVVVNNYPDQVLNYMLPAVGLLIFIAYKKGEKPRWRWG